MKKAVPHKYQLHSKQHILDNKFCALFLDMGLGKTLSTLLALDELLYSSFDAQKVLVIAPKKVAESTWPEELTKWSDFSHMTFSVVAGNENERISAVRKHADIYIIGVDNFVWLKSYLGSHFPFDTVVIDELSKFKSSKARRFKTFKTVRSKIKRVIGLTGTPAPNGLMDLWAQIYCLDNGSRLGEFITHFRSNYFDRDYNGFSYEPKAGAKENIFRRIEDICISMKTEDYLELPPIINITKKVTLDSATLKKYKDFERSSVLELIDEEITAVNAGVLRGKLQQFANGAVYHEDKSYTIFHDEKMDMLEELVEEANGQSVLIFYHFRHDLQRILKRFPGARQLLKHKDVTDWNEGKVELMVCHPASAGHGLNLQGGGHIAIWIAPTDNLEHWQQAPKRLHRQGQAHPVTIYVIITRGTVDDLVIQRTIEKGLTQDELLEATKALIRQYITER